MPLSVIFMNHFFNKMYLQQYIFLLNSNVFEFTEPVTIKKLLVSLVLVVVDPSSFTMPRAHSSKLKSKAADLYTYTESKQILSC